MTSDRLQTEFLVGADAFMDALEHGVRLWNDESTPTFRLDQRGGRSGFTRYVNARIEGKLGEEAFVQFLAENYGIEAVVDYRIYGDRSESDHGDCQHVVGDDGGKYDPAVEFDVKKTKLHNDWLAIRQNVLDRHPDDAPFVVTALSIEDDLLLDAWEDETWGNMTTDPMFQARLVGFAETHFPLDAHVLGAVYPDEFTHEFESGDRLFDPETEEPIGGPLRRDNVAMPLRDITSGAGRWDRVVSDIVNDLPVEV